MFRKFTQWLDRPPKNPQQDNHTCHFPGCQEAGSYRAPKSRYHLDHGLNDWSWFCLIHIRDYNARWNYYEGMAEHEITAERENDVTWDRPSWPLGQKAHKQDFVFIDPFDLFPDSQASASSSAHSPLSTPKTPEEKAIVLLDLPFVFSAQQLQQHYRRLVKLYHPDCNGHTSESEEKIREINEAYALLKKIKFNERGI